MVIWIVLLAMTAAAVMAVLWPLSRHYAVGRQADPDTQFYRSQIGEIERDLARGVLLPNEAEAAKAEADEQRSIRRDFVRAAQSSFGNLLTMPVGGGLLYVTPVYTQRQGSTGSYPALRFVIVRFGQSVGIGDTLQQALDEVFAGN